MQSQKDRTKTNRLPQPKSYSKVSSDVERLEKTYNWGCLFAVVAVLSSLSGLGIFGQGAGLLDNLAPLIFYAPLSAVIALFLLIFVLSSGVTPKTDNEAKRMKKATSSARLTILLMFLCPIVAFALLAASQ